MLFLSSKCYNNHLTQLIYYNQQQTIKTYKKFISANNLTAQQLKKRIF
jgi:hypothetical protein